MSKHLTYDDSRLTSIRTRAELTAERLGPAQHGFLHQEAAEILGERLAVTKRTFNSPAILFEGPFSRLIADTISQCDAPINTPFQFLAAPTDKAPLLAMEPASLDLVVTVFDAHRVNDLPSLMLQINLALKPDGLFLGVFPSAGTMNELASALMEAELAATGGAAMRVDLFPEIRQFGDLLQKSGFKLPVCDVEERTIRYHDLAGLLKEIRGAGASSASPRGNPTLPKSVRRVVDKIYREKFSDLDGKIRATVNMAFLSGWKEDASQQKPLRPGSAKNQLKDFL